jgi:hypothetical protein
VWPSCFCQMDFVAFTAQTELVSTKQTYNKKLEYSRVTFKSLQQKDVNLTLVLYCINKFDRGFFSFSFSGDVKMEY